MIAKWWDQLRGGPEIRNLRERWRAAEDELQSVRVGHEKTRRDLSHQLQQANERVRLLQEFARSRVKARCAGGCGDLHFDFTLHLASDNGTPVLVPICDGCKRRRAQEAAREKAATGAASA